MNTSLYLREARAELTRASRTPAFVIPTLLLPLAFYALFGIVLASPGSGTAAYALATYGVFAGLGPALFGFGALIAADRDAGILALKQVAPLPAAAFLFARLATALTFTVVVLIGLYTLAAWGGGVTLPRGAWVYLLAVHLAGVVPFCLLGLCLGLRVGSSVAIALSNILFLALAVLGGLWVPLFMFPVWMQHFARALPSYHLGALALDAAGHTLPDGAAVHWLFIAGFTLLSAALAAHSWQAPRR